MTLESLISSLKNQGVISTDRVINVMRKVDRGRYVPSDCSPYEDRPMPIGDGQTISAPHMHGQALELLQHFLHPGRSALDVGCGSGYLTACMGEMVSPGGNVIGIENRQSLVELSQKNIKMGDPHLLSDGVVRIAKGNGWTGEGFLTSDRTENVFDAIHVGAAAESVPEVLMKALKSPGRMVIPVGPQWGSQVFVVIDKASDGTVSQRELMSVMYVPLEQSPRSRGF